MAETVTSLANTDRVIDVSVGRLIMLVKACRIVGLEAMAEELLYISDDLTGQVGVSLKAYTAEMQEQTAHAKEMCGNILTAALRGKFGDPR